MDNTALYISKNINTQNWSQFCEYFEIPFNFFDLYQQLDKIDTRTVNALIIDYTELNHLFQHHRPWFLNFLENSYIVVVEITDSPAIFADNSELMNQIDQHTQSTNCQFYLETHTVNSNYNHINILCDPISYFFNLVHTRNSIFKSFDPEKDFLIMLGRGCIERTELWNQLDQCDILDQSISIYHACDLNDATLIGKIKHIENTCSPMVASMDLYNQCAVEIVAETCATKISWFTEKTIRPIATKMPFVLLAYPGSLQHLKLLGFETFGDFIDESYDQEPNLDLRIQAVVSACQQIKEYGIKNFVNDTMPIVEHNFENLLKIQGEFQIEKDKNFLSLLQKINAV